MLDENAEYNITAKKPDGKWHSHGNIRKNGFGNLQIGLKVTEELKDLIRAKKSGEWVNLSIFKKDSDKKSPSKPSSSAPSPDWDNEAPF